VIKQVRRQNKRKQKKNSSVAKEKGEMLLQIAAYIRQSNVDCIVEVVVFVTGAGV
jgi:hypothetical protein